jgi:hypothetical protein
MINLNNQHLKKFIELGLEQLTGDWIIIGGTILPLLEIDYRVTTDIDLAFTTSGGKDQTLELMQIAEQMSLPIEAINQAGAFFLFRISDWKNKIILLKKNKKTAFYRPNTTLFLELKIARMSETDLMDCFKMIEYFKHELDGKKINRLIKSELQKEKSNKDRAKRLKELDKIISLIISK